MCCVKRVRNRDGQAAGRFLPLEDSTEFSDDGSIGGSQPEAARLDCQDIETGRAADGLGVMTGILAHLGINKFDSRSQHPRRDMFGLGWTLEHRAQAG